MNQIELLEFAYLNAVDCGSEDLLLIWDELQCLKEKLSTESVQKPEKQADATSP